MTIFLSYQEHLAIILEKNEGGTMMQILDTHVEEWWVSWLMNINLGQAWDITLNSSIELLI